MRNKNPNGCFLRQSRIKTIKTAQTILSFSGNIKARLIMIKTAQASMMLHKTDQEMLDENNVENCSGNYFHLFSFFTPP